MTDSGYRHYYGQDWPPVPDGKGGFTPMSKEYAGLLIGKKWRFFRDQQGVEFKDPWEPWIESATSLLGPENLKVTPWTEQHMHDFVMEDKLIEWGCALCEKSHIFGLNMVLFYVTDPFDSVILLGSTTKEALKSRSWNSVQFFHAALKKNQRGFFVPGKITKAGYALINESDSDSPESAGEKAGIQGRALNEDGNLQGAHAKYVILGVDELATIKNHDVIETAMSNLRAGTMIFKMVGLANPESWDDPSCKYCIPEPGVKVDVDTGHWRSTRGYFVRHYDGLKSPCILHPELAAKFPFLPNKERVEAQIQDADGNTDAPVVWKMVRGFPMSNNVSTPVVLDRKIAVENRACEPPVDYGPPVAVAAGIDPAWSEGGDGAIYQRVLVRQSRGMYILDFTNGLHRLAIRASAGKPVAQQLVEQVRDIMNAPGDYCAPLSATAVDASANQGLADDLDMYIGQGVACCVHVNNSMRASSNPIRAIGVGMTDQQGGRDRKVETCKDRYQDRGTEAWCVLAEFIKAGQVRGLSEEVVNQLSKRRFALISKKVNGVDISSGVRFPLQLERKEDFKSRNKNKSPDECDGASLAALAVKEVLGLLPFGWLKPAEAPLVGDGGGPQRYAPCERVDIPDPESYSSESDSGPSGEEDSGW